MESFGANRAAIPEKDKEIEAEKFQRNEPLDEAITDATNIKRRISDLEKSLEVARKRLSNIPDRQHAIRSLLCEELELEEEDLPFLAELVEVKSEEGAWRGAIERAVGTMRLNILVPEEYMDRSLRYINDRNNGQDVRLREVKKDAKPARFREDSFLFKLNFKKHAYRETVKFILAAYDRRCVDTPEALKHINHGLTREGLMSGGRGYFEKLDSTRLDQNWMTGFTSNDRIHELSRDIEAEKERLAVASTTRTKLSNFMRELEQQSLMLSAFKTIEYHNIDLSIENKQIADYLALIEEMSSESSDLNDAKSRWDFSRKNFKRQLEKHEELVRTQDRCENILSILEVERERVINVIGEGISDDQRELMLEVVPIGEIVDSETLKVMENNTREKLRDDHSNLIKRIGDIEKKLVSLMNRAKQVDNGPLSEAGVDIPDIPSYLDRLQVLEEEDLPAKEVRFLEYLRETTDQSVT
ncbi:hypothetical protein BOW53_08220 [Solemya pervernicosa gill symbiont]|uniref:SMC hinge domain-containing protein n=1 Tax=Solemya pervernicosa gill symbiont TaxID=642797 RepID=A0A1T2L5C0_9GAMM|nr:hypothetical protein [Solemya pervernicosa gill symbiont]OOZ40283.1 hypothetical protein BOW53_08220 [Solemya pervernicosa gill symbiont]